MSEHPTSPAPDRAPHDDGPAAPVTDFTLAHAVRYSLPLLLAEIQQERRTGAFAQDKLDQTEIKKLFQRAPRRPRRATPDA